MELKYGCLLKRNASNLFSVGSVIVDDRKPWYANDYNAHFIAKDIASLFSELLDILHIHVTHP